MKISPRILFAAGVLTVCSWPAAGGVTVSSTVNQVIPDGSLLGLPSSLEVSGLDSPLGSITVSLSLSAASGDEAFLGDLYAYLEHDGRTAVLLNRPGRTAEQAYGYDDNAAVSVRFVVAGADIHDYRGPGNTPLGGTLAGDWGADGRAVSPLTVLSLTPRTAGLEVFAGTDPNGTWNLLVADVSGGAQHRWLTWAVELQSVPEPAWGAVWVAGGLVWFVTRGSARREARRRTR